jgi:hypothetical protein
MIKIRDLSWILNCTFILNDWATVHASFFRDPRLVYFRAREGSGSLQRVSYTFSFLSSDRFIFWGSSSLLRWIYWLSMAFSRYPSLPRSTFMHTSFHTTMVFYIHTSGLLLFCKFENWVPKGLWLRLYFAGPSLFKREDMAALHARRIHACVGIHREWYFADLYILLLCLVI